MEEGGFVCDSGDPNPKCQLQYAEGGTKNFSNDNQFF